MPRRKDPLMRIGRLRYWKTIGQLAKHYHITENAARKRAKKYTDLGTWERKLVNREGRWVLAFRDFYWPKHPSHSNKE